MGLTTFAEQVSEAVLVTDRDGTVRYVNPAFERMTGYSQEEIIGRHGGILDDDARSDSIGRRLRATMADGKVWRGRVSGKKRDGTLIKVESTMSPIRDGSEAITGCVATVHAVGQEARLESQLRSLQRTGVTGTLAGVVAHEFNNLLVGIFGYVDLVRGTFPEESTATRSLQMVEDAARRARDVAEAVRAFGRTVGTPKALNIVKVVADAMCLCRKVLALNIEVIAATPSEGEIWVSADAAQLQQILLNLVLNAGEAMTDGGRLSVALSRETLPQGRECLGPAIHGPSDVDFANARAVLVVEDTGVGMPDDVRLHMFDPFFTTKPPEQAAGLGLTVVHGIVTNHGGQLSVDSQPGQGTRMTVKLPCCEPPDDSSPEPAPADAKRGHGEMIIVVDQDQHVRSIMISMLRRRGYDVAQACDGVEALTILDAHRSEVRLAIVDMDLPKKSEPHCLDQMRRMLPDLPVVVTTAYVNCGVEQELNANTSILRKPFQMADLIATVDHLLTRRLARDRV